MKLFSARLRRRLCFRQIATKEGLPGFYRGFGAMMVGLVPASAAYFGGCDAYVVDGGLQRGRCMLLASRTDVARSPGWSGALRFCCMTATLLQDSGHASHGMHLSSHARHFDVVLLSSAGTRAARR